MTFEHIVYIPGVVLVGLTIGYLLGLRAARAEIAEKQRRAKR